MEAAELLLQLEILEEGLFDFSFNQLTSTEAIGVREKFEVFKTDLNRKIYNETFAYDNDDRAESNPDMANLSEKIRRPILQMTEAIMRLKRTGTSENQHYLIESLELATMVLTELTTNKNHLY